VADLRPCRYTAKHWRSYNTNDALLWGHCDHEFCVSGHSSTASRRRPRWTARWPNARQLWKRLALASAM